MDNSDIRSFWDIDQYRRVIKRIENGYRSCDHFLSMVQERAEIELRYAKSLRKWTEKWTGTVEKGSEYGSTAEAWRTCLQEGAIVAQIHEDCRLKIMGEEGAFYNMYKWKKEHHHKGAFGSLQEAREANDGFAAIQKEYSRLLGKTERAKKAYHAACVSAHKAALFARQESTDPSVRPEFKRKLHQRAAKFAAQRDRVKQVYLKRVMKCNGPAKERYVQEMTGEFTRWQKMERVRLDTAHAQLILFMRAIDTVSFSGLGELYQRLEEGIGRADSLADVQDWDIRYGTGCEQHWPRFEELDIDELNESATFADVERKTSFGNALMNRRRQKSNHRRSRSGLYSSVREFDDEDEFTGDDDFDSTFDDSEDVLDEHDAVHHAPHDYSQQTAHHYNQGDPQRSRQHLAGGSGGGNSGHSSHHQPFGVHHELSTHYGEQGKTGSHDYNHQNNQHVWGGYDDGHDRTNVTNGKSSNHQLDSNGRRLSHHAHLRHSLHAVRNQHESPRSPMSSKAYHVTQWRDNQTWQPVSYNYGRDAGGKTTTSNTPPTRDVEFPVTRDSSQQHQNQPDGRSPQVGGAITAQSNYRSPTVQGYPQAEVMAPQQHASSSYSIQHSGGNGAELTSTQPSATYGAGQTPAVATLTTQSPWNQTTSGRDTAAAVHHPGTPPNDGQHSEESSSRHERHATINQAKNLLHLEDGEFMVRAMYDFNPGTRDELPLKAGEVLVQTGKHAENGWAFGRNLERTGIFPASYVRAVR